MVRAEWLRNNFPSDYFGIFLLLSIRDYYVTLGQAALLFLLGLTASLLSHTTQKKKKTLIFLCFFALVKKYHFRRRKLYILLSSGGKFVKPHNLV